MNSKLRDFFLQIRKKWALINLVTCFSFLIGLTNTILFSVPISSFLQDISSRKLPLIYMALGLFMVIFGWIFDFIQKKCSLFLSICIPLILFSILQFLFGIALVSKDPLQITLCLVGSILIVFFSQSILVILYYRLFTTNELKIVYGLFLGAVSIGGIFMGISIPYFLKKVPSNTLLFLSSIISLINIVVLFFIRKHEIKNFCNVNPKSTFVTQNEMNNSSRKIKKFIYVIFTTTTISYFIYLFIDYIFNSVTQKFYSDELDRTIFFSYFNASLEGMNLIFSFFIYPWIYLKFGQRGAFLLFPFTIGILCTLGLILNYSIFNLFLLFFFISATNLFLNSFLDTTFPSSIFQFFQPFKKSLKDWAEFKNEMIIAPCSMIVVGFILFIFQNLEGFNFFILTLITIVFCIFLIGIYYFYLEKNYIHFLVNSISRNIFKLSNYLKFGKDEISILEKSLTRQIPEEIIYSLTLLENINASSFTNYLQKVMLYPNQDIKLYCLQKIYDKHLVSLKNEVKSILDTNSNPLIFSKALLTYGSINSKIDDFENLLKDDENHAPDVISSVISAYLLYGSTPKRETALKRLHSLINSSKENDRIIAAKIIQNYSNKIFLLQLLNDPSQEVRKIVSSKCLIIDQDIMHSLFNNIKLPLVKNTAINTIVHYPDIALNEAKTRFSSESPEIKKIIISIIGLLKTSQSQDFLSYLLNLENRFFFKRILRGLIVNKSSEIKINLKDLLKKELKNILFLKDKINYFGDKSTEIIFCLLSREIEISQGVCFLILSLIYPDISFSSINTWLLQKDENFQSNLDEILLIKTKYKESKILSECLSFSPKKGNGSFEEVKHKLLEVLSYGSNAYIPSIRSAAVYSLGLLGCKDCLKIIEDQEDNLDPLMKEFKAISINFLK